MQDYGIVYEDKLPGNGSITYQLLLTEKRNARKIVIKQRSSVAVEFTTSYFQFDFDGARRLKDALEKILGLHR
jgi:hypothetical protein